MKKTSTYYIVSGLTLALMMVLMLRSLRVIGWFDSGEILVNTKHLLQIIPGNYAYSTSSNIDPHFSGKLQVEKLQENADRWLQVKIDSLERYRARTSDFEDDQVLLELFVLDSVGAWRRWDGCEMLLSRDEYGAISGGTIGEFCSLSSSSAEYLVLELYLRDTTSVLQVDTKRYRDNETLKSISFELERNTSHE